MNGLLHFIDIESERVSIAIERATISNRISSRIHSFVKTIQQ